MKLPLSLLIPLLVCILALLQGGLLYVHSLYGTQTRIEENLSQEMASTLARMQGTLAYLFKNNDLAQIEQEVTSFGEDLRVKLAMLVDEEGRVLASIHMGERNQEIEDVLQSLDVTTQTRILENRKLVLSSMRGMVTTLPAEQCVSGIYPVVLNWKSTGIRPERIGALLVCMDLSVAMEQVADDLRNRMALITGGLVLFSVLLATLLNLLITRRLHRILDVTRRFAAGDYHLRTGMKGADELSQVGQSFDRMAQDVEAAHVRLQEREVRFNAIFNSMFQFIGLLDADGRLLEANQTSLDFIAAKNEDVIGKFFWDTPWWETDEKKENLKAAVHEAKKGKFVRIEVQHASDNGQVIDVDFSLSPIMDEQGEVILMVPEGRDITSLKAIMRESEELAKRLQEAELQWQRAMEFFVDPVYVSDENGTILQANRALLEFFGVTSDDVMRGRAKDVFHGSCREGGFEDAAYLRDRSIVLEVEDAANPFAIPIEITSRVIADSRGGKQGLLTGIHDLSERRALERELRVHRDHLEELVAVRTASLETSNRELEAFSYSVSHDLRSPLRAINGYSQFLLDDYADRLDEAATGYLQRMQAASARMACLIDDLLQLAGVTRQALSHENVNLSALAEQIMADLCEQSPQRSIEFVNEPEMWVKGDAGLMRIVLANLLENACKFTRANDHAVIRFGSRLVDGVSAYFVEDNGVGFEMKYAANLFKPFHRLHALGEFEGNGIGLATVERIISRHRGRVWVEAQKGKGAVFLFTLGSGSHR